MEYGPATALVVVDVQNDFADSNGSLYVRGGERVVEAVNAEVSRAQSAGSPIFYTQDWHPESTPHFEKDGGVWPVHCVGDSWGAEFHRDLVVTGTQLRKGTGGEDGYSGFSMRDPRSGDETSTGLAEELRRAGIRRVMVVGLATDYCVKATALDAVALGFETEVVQDAIAAVDLAPGDGEEALQEMRAAGATIT